jgi:hypothetical protein
MTTKTKEINHYSLFRKSLENITGIKWIPEFHVYKEDKKGARPLRADLANPELKIAIEIEGGIYGLGGHSSITGIIRDIKKNNAYVSNGWKLIRLLPQDLMTSASFDLIKKVIDLKVKK